VALPLANFLDAIFLCDLGNFLEGIFFLVVENFLEGIFAIKLTRNRDHEKWPAAQRAASLFLRPKRSGKALGASGRNRPSELVASRELHTSPAPTTRYPQCDGRGWSDQDGHR
jgi:hypothetical protein